MSKGPRTAFVVGAGTLALALALSACAGDAGSAGSSSNKSASQAEIDTALKTPTTLTFWTHVPNIQNEVDLFEKAYPAIKVKVENVNDYPKIRAALKAGKGAPDVVQITYQNFSSFTFTGSLLDLAPYGANDLKKDYVGWVWNQVTQGNKVYGIPQDSGPMGNLYREDIFTKAKISQAPATWDDYATDAAAVKSKTSSYISNLAPNDAGLVLGLLWQAGVKPFGYDGKAGVTVNVAGPESKKVMAYWQDLIRANLVSVDPDFTDQWYQGLASGKYASWLTAAWGPGFLEGTAANTSGKWRAAEMPQWTAGGKKSGNWGGSADVVLKTTAHPIAAYELAKWINQDKSSTMELATKQFLFPTRSDVLSDPSFLGQKSAFYGGQEVNKLFAESSVTVDKTFEWLPYMEFASSSFNDTLGKAIADKSDLSAGLDAWQKALKDYGTQQGFKVK